MNKVNLISDFMNEHSLDVFGVAETWLLPDVPDSFVAIINYGIARTDTCGNTRKHGVCVYVHKRINFVYIEANCSNVCVAHLIDFNLYIIVIYRPPSNLGLDNSDLINFLLSFCIGKEVLILGDFNLPAIAWNNDEFMFMSHPPLQQLFLDCFTSLGLHQWVTSPTFVHSGNVLDLVLSVDSDRVGDVGVLGNFPNCGHCPVVLQYYFQSGVDISSPDVPNKYSWYKGKYNRIENQLSDVDWEYELCDLTVDEMFSKLKSILSPLINRHVPIQPTSSNHSNKHSPPNALRESRKNAWQSYKQIRNTHGRQSELAENALENYNNINYRFRNYFIHSQINYEKSLAGKIKSSPKCLHRYIRNKKVGALSVGPLRKENGDLTADCHEMAEMLSDAFCSVYTAQDLNFPFPHQRSNATLGDVEITLDDVRDRLNSLDPNTSMGPDEIHPLLLKSCPSLAVPLHMIFKESLAQGKLPRDWKKSNIIPLFKKGSRHTPLNYRPISLTSVCCKTMERILGAALYDHLVTNQILSDDQYGFVRGRTVDDQLLLVYDEVSSWVDSGFVVDVVLFDFSKAFDVVSHTVLIEKLKSLGVGNPLLGWLSDFLVGRIMSVSVSGVGSALKLVISGVPQGSVLGPILFLIFINYLPSHIRSRCKLFADDLKIYMKLRHDSVLGLAQDLSSVQRDIDQVQRVAESWGLNFNETKCATLRFQRGTVDWADVGSLQHYTLNDSDIAISDCQKDLGILVDNSLKFHAHIMTTVNKAAGLSNNLIRSTKCRSAEFMMTVYKTHIRPLLEFGSVVWNTGYVGDLKLLESVQRSWTKQVDGLSELDYSQRLSILNLYSVQGRLLRADLIKCWKIFHKQSAVSPSDIFTFSSVASTRGHRFKVAKPHVSIECRRRFFSVRVIDSWNNLPDRVVSADSIEVFKRGLHQALGEELFAYVDN